MRISDWSSDVCSSDLVVKGMRALLRGRHASITWGLVVCGVAWGLVNFGFVLWLPVNLVQFGVDAEGVNRVLAQSALLALPGIAVVVWMYHRWSSVRPLVRSEEHTSELQSLMRTS